MPYNILIINVPQRYQDVAGTSPLTAAIRLIPFNIFISFTGFVVNGFIAKKGVACVCILLVTYPTNWRSRVILRPSRRWNNSNNHV